MNIRITTLLAAILLLVVRETAAADNSGFVYAYVLHDSHTAETFYSADALKPVGPPQAVRPYFELLLQRESHADSLLIPQILNDNYGLLAGGIQFQGRRGLRAFAQVGQAFAFGPQTPTAWNLRRSDFRGGLELYRNWNDAMNSPRRAIGAFFGSAIYYSRYQNAIAYAQAERGYELGSSEHPLQLYARVSADMDTRRFFYNNLVSATVGARLLPLGHIGPSIALEESSNTFVGPLAPITAAGETRQFFSFRPVLSFGTNF